MNHQEGLSPIGFLSNKYTPSRSRGFSACISSRITTVIHVARYHQINYNWFNEPFAVSQYKQFILRHAWLNLWDKHMTTGRINQVTISERHPPKQGPQGFHWTNLVTNLRVCYRFVSSTDNWVDTRRHESSELALVWPVTLCSSTIPVLLTLLVFSMAQKSNRSASSLKITFRVA